MEEKVICFNDGVFLHDGLETTFISLVYTISEVYQWRKVVK